MSEKPSKQKIVAELIADREELVELLSSLSEQEWKEPSLCEGWQVRDVVAHLVSAQADLGAILKNTIIHRGNFPKAEQMVIDDYRKMPLPALLNVMVANIQPRGLFAKVAMPVLFHESWVHQEDIRWVLGSNRQREHNPTRLRMILDAQAAGLQKKLEKGQGIAKKVKFSVPELNWSVGQGAEVSGDGASIIMALYRRPAALERLQGPGVAVLAEGMQKSK